MTINIALGCKREVVSDPGRVSDGSRLAIYQAHSTDSIILLLSILFLVLLIVTFLGFFFFLMFFFLPLFPFYILALFLFLCFLLELWRCSPFSSSVQQITYRIGNHVCMVIYI